MVHIDKLVFKYKGDEDFSKFDNVFDLINKISDGEISLNEPKPKDDETKLRSDMGEIKKGAKKIFIKTK